MRSKTCSRAQRLVSQAARCDSSSPHIFHRASMATAACALAAALLATHPHSAMAAEIAEATPQLAISNEAVEPVYFGNGCFWGRQYDFVNAEQALGRFPGDISAVVGYAGGAVPSPSNKVCYYYTPDKDAVYERLGHAEVVQVELRGADVAAREAQFKKMADTYFTQFRRLPNGKMLRQDPQDAGPGYRNVIGIPGGVNSPLYPILQAANVNNMELRPGSGGQFTPDGQPAEDDLLNVVWVVDSEKLPFYQAEQYHQYHNGLGKKFPEKYTKEMKEAAMKAGRVKSTGCPEYFFMGS